MLKKMGEDKDLLGVFDTEEDVVALRSRAWSVIKALNKVGQYYKFKHMLIPGHA